jgi:hypothetical protein
VADEKPPARTGLVLGRLEAMDPIAVLEGARATTSPFTVADLQGAK